MTENCKLRKAILSAFYNILQRNFGILLNLWLFQAVMKFLSRLVEFKILVNWGMVHCMERLKLHIIRINDYLKRDELILIQSKE
jgi:hypothetical protein